MRCYQIVSVVKHDHSHQLLVLLSPKVNPCDGLEHGGHTEGTSDLPPKL